MPENFLDSGMLSFRVTPKSDRLDVFVTKSNIDKHLNFGDLGELPDLEELSHMSPDDFIKTLEKTIGEKTQADIEAIESLAKVEAEEDDEASQEDTVEPDRYIYYILQFSNLTETVAYVKTVDFEVDTSELYKMDNHYFLTILVDLENKPSAYPTWLLARMREYADDTDMTRAVLQEHGRAILVGEAISRLREVASV